MKGYALITGASSGFGQAIAHSLANEGYSLILAARRTERLESLKEKLSQLPIHIELITVDVREEQAVIAAITSLPENVKDRIVILVKNAGLAVGRGPID